MKAGARRSLLIAVSAFALLAAAPGCSGSTCAALCTPPTATFVMPTPLAGTVLTLTGHYVALNTYVATTCERGDGSSSFSCAPMHTVFDAEGLVGMFDQAGHLQSVIWDNPTAGDLHLHVDLDGHEGYDHTFTYARAAGGATVCGQACIASATFTAN